MINKKYFRLPFSKLATQWYAPHSINYELPAVLGENGDNGSSGISVMVVTLVGVGVGSGVRIVMKVVTTVGVGPPTLKTVPMVFVMMVSSPSSVSESSVP